MPRSLKVDEERSTAFSMRAASINCWQIPFAISRDILKVVVVVVVRIRAGSFGSGPRLDWENLREERLAAASSLHGSAYKHRIGGYLRCKAVREDLEEAAVCVEGK